VRILILSNYYPPNTRGGYELRCSETAVELAKRGHVVSVLTSRIASGVTAATLDGVAVSYGLYLEANDGPFQTAIRFFLLRQRHDAENRFWVEALITEFQPDVVFVWGMWNVPKSVPYRAEELIDDRIVYHISDYWPALPSAYYQYWKSASGRKVTVLPKIVIAHLALRQLKRIPEPVLKYRHPTCISQALKGHLVAAGIPIHHADVLPSGIKIGDFRFVQKTTTVNRLRVVYAGRLTKDKGLHTAVEAFLILSRRMHSSFAFDVIGSGDELYTAKLKEMASSAEIPIRFLGGVDRQRMPKVLAGYDVLVFPSEWDEPFARVVLEAMAVGLVVVGTATGGTKEVLVDGQTGLVFPAGNATALANALERLRSDLALRRRLAEQGCKVVCSEFSHAKMVDRFEVYLKQVVSGLPCDGP